MSTPDTRYIPAFSINTIITNKDDAAALANGTVNFYSDVSRTTPKAVYRLAGYPNYYFESLGYSLTLSSIGTFVDQDGNPVVPYFFPYDASGNEELYYITCYSQNSIFQFDREAVPYLQSSGDVTTQTETTSINQVSNPQFVEKLFEGTNYTYSVTGSQTTPIAPGWDLITSGTGTVQVQQLSNIAATEPTSPPYAMQFLSTGLTGTYKLRQRIYQSPKLFYDKYVASSFIVSVSSTAVILLRFEPSSGGSYDLNIDQVAATGTYTTLSDVTLFNQSASTDPATTGYVDLVFYIPVGVTVSLSSVQLLTVAASDAQIAFQQQSTPQQQSFLYWYDRPGLIYKPIKSFLTGWDFPLNPAQFGETVAAAAIGANKSQYVWDQTILFQSANSGVSVARASGNNALELTAAATTQMAIIQYLDEAQARKLLNGPLSVNVSAKASASTNACVSLWYTTDVSLPDVSSGTNNSIVATLDTNGKPATFNGTWSEVPRSSMGDAKFTIGTSATTEFNDYAFTGWDMNGIAAVNTATYFAIVVGTASVTATGILTFNSVSLVPGVIPTIPAPQTPDEVLRECQYYYESNYPVGVVAGTANSVGAITEPQQVYATGGNVSFITSGFTTKYTLKRAIPVMTYWSVDGTVDRISARVVTDSADSGYGNLDAAEAGGFWTYSPNTKYNSMAITSTAHLSANPTQPGTYGTGFITYNFSSDARLGIV